MKDYIKVFLCDDHTLFRQGIRKLLELENDIKVVGEASNGSEIINLIKKLGPNVILMDINMPEMNGITATRRIKKILPHAKIIILTVCKDEHNIFEAIKAGAMGYLLKDVSINKLLEAIRTVYKNEALIQPMIAAKILKEFAVMNMRKRNTEDRFYYLSEREKEVLRLLILGGTNKEIARKLNIAEKTVKNHLSKIYQTFHVNNRTQAVLYALNNEST